MILYNYIYIYEQVCAHGNLQIFNSRDFREIRADFEGLRNGLRDLHDCSRDLSDLRKQFKDIYREEIVRSGHGSSWPSKQGHPREQECEGERVIERGRG